MVSWFCTKEWIHCWKKRFLFPFIFTRYFLNLPTKFSELHIYFSHFFENRIYNQLIWVLFLSKKNPEMHRLLFISSEFNFLVFGQNIWQKIAWWLCESFFVKKLRLSCGVCFLHFLQNKFRIFTLCYLDSFFGQIFGWNNALLYLYSIWQDRK